MELIIHEMMVNVTEKLLAIITTSLETGKDFSHITSEMKKAFDCLGVSILEEMMKTLDDTLKKDGRRKNKWLVERKDKKSLATIFGQINYKKTYYKSKTDGKYVYLLDKVLGLENHQKIEDTLKIKLVEEALDTSYEKSSKKASIIPFSKQTVMNTLREIEVNPQYEDKSLKALKQVKLLYIQADEDHVALQTQKGCAEPKLVVVHEGYKDPKSTRKELKNPYYIGGLHKNSEELWLEVSKYIAHHYDVDELEKVYITGDGASWIKEGVNWIEKSVYVLDKFHLSHYIKRATAHDLHASRKVWKRLRMLDLEGIKEGLKIAKKSATTEAKLEAIEVTRRYIVGNWEAIKRQKDNEYIGCSVEGHISHVYASRMSSRPMGWSEQGVDQMSRLLVYRKNGSRIDKVINNKKKRSQQKIKLNKRQVRNLLKGNSNELINNIPVLSAGIVHSWEYRILKALRA